MTARRFTIISGIIILFLGSCKKENDPVDAVVGSYVGTMHYTYSYYSAGNPSSNRSIDTTYAFTFIVSKVSSNQFTTNELSAGNSSGYFQFQSSSNVYNALFCPSPGACGYGPDLTFYPSSGRATFDVSDYDSQGGGSVYSASCTEVFSGTK